MASQRVDLYTFFGNGFHVNAILITPYSYDNVPSIEISDTQSYQYKKHSFEMPGTGSTNPDAWLRLEIYHEGVCIDVRVIAVSGNTGYVTEGLKDVSACPSIVTDKFCYSFGFYYSDMGLISTGLTNGHQLYVVVTQNQSRWMQRLFAELGSKRNDVKFSDLILPGSHDAGMYTQQPMYHIAAFANTQKDSISNQLAMGARIFDFRPGILRDGWASKLMENLEKVPDYLKTLLRLIRAANDLENMYMADKNVIRHIHAFIPGDTYQHTVTQIVEFLKTNPEEIVVIDAASSGINIGCVELADKKELDTITSEVINQYYPALKVGSENDINRPIYQLLNENLRLIVLYHDIPGTTNSTIARGSYLPNIKDYESTNSLNVLSAISKVNDEFSTFDKMVEMSLQLTATATDGGAKRIILSDSNQSVSPLFATKAATDQLTYTWLMNNGIKKVENGPLVTVSNDFYDPGLTEAVVFANKRRLNLTLPSPKPPKAQAMLTIQSVQNNKFICASDGLKHNQWLWCKDGTPLTFVFEGSLNNFAFRVKDHNLYLSYQDSGGVKLWHSPEGAYFSLESRGNGIYAIRNLKYNQYVWLSGTSPYLTRTGNPDNAAGQWRISWL